MANSIRPEPFAIAEGIDDGWKGGAAGERMDVPIVITVIVLCF